MDGPFFSIMPFGNRLHSLTSVTFTPHVTSYEELPTFQCQRESEDGRPECRPEALAHCIPVSISRTQRMAVYVASGR
ncbi:MAG: hypothetical protein V8S42_01555, partial [Lachnospiraceae bacterium]